MAPMLRAREACCSIKFQSPEWGQLWGRKINYNNFTFNIIYLRVKYGGETGNRLQPAAGLQEFGVRYILSSSSKSSHASCRENFISTSP